MVKLMISMEKLLCSEKTLYWLEVLGLLKGLDAAQSALRDINERSEVNPELQNVPYCILTQP